MTRTLAKMQAVSSPTIEDQVDGFNDENGTNVSGEIGRLETTDVTANSPEEFERRIDSELAALDSLDTKKRHRCSDISEDLLEFSENLIDCDAEDDSEDDDADTLAGSPEVKRRDQVDGQNESMTRTSDHVSCEDLLDFADGPNLRRTRGPSNGESSDEVGLF